MSNEDIIVTLIGESAIVAFYYQEKRQIRLHPGNKTMEPIAGDKCRILGKVFASFRMLN